MKSMLLYIPEDLHRRLKEYAEEKKMSMTMVVIKALGRFLDKEKDFEEKKVKEK